jgi:tetratricopeptide (TPR) repeat protein
VSTARNNRIAFLINELRSTPNDLFFNYALGLEYDGSSNYRGAVEQFLKVLSIDAEYLAAFYQLGKAYEHIGNSAEALDFLRRGLEIARRKRDAKSVNEFEEAIFLLED